MAHTKFPPKILLTGPPGVGKTTVIVRLASLLGANAAGFYTAEVREGGARVGFKVVTLGGKEELLAHIAFSSPYRVGKYRVKPESLRGAVAEIRKALEEGGKYLLIDEIGKMELFAAEFRVVVSQAFESNLPLVATVPQKPLPFAEPLKKRIDVTLLEVTRFNRDRLPEEIYSRLMLQPGQLGN